MMKCGEPADLAVLHDIIPIVGFDPSDARRPIQVMHPAQFQISYELRLFRMERLEGAAVVAPTRELPGSEVTGVVVERFGDSDKETVLPLIEEALRVGKRRVETGRVRISIGTEEEQVVRQTLRSELAAVERIAIGRELTEGESAPIISAPIIRRDPDGTVVVPLLEEILVVERRLVLREELRLRVSSTEETVEETVTLRRQRAVVDHLPPAPPSGASQPNGPSLSDGSSTRITSSKT